MNVTARTQRRPRRSRRRLRRRRLQRRRPHGSLRHDGADDELLWNNGNGTFTEGARSHGVVSFGWHAGAAVARRERRRPSRSVRRAATRRRTAPIPGSMAGYPTNHLGVRDLLFLNEGNGPDGRARFREVGRQAGHRPGAVRPLARRGLHRRQRRRPAGSLRRERRGPEPPLRERAGQGRSGFHFVDRARADGRRGRERGHGDRRGDFSGDGRPTSSSATRAARRTRLPAARRRRFANVQPALRHGLRRATRRLGRVWIDLDNSGRPDLVLANGTIPITRLGKDAQPLQVLVHVGRAQLRRRTASSAPGGCA